MTESVRLSAPAKLTLSLAVTGVRADGYHLIDAEMTALGFGDEVIITEADTTMVDIEGPAGSVEIPAGPDNLVARALAAAGRTAHVRLIKNIPAGAGLGGGSSDAAAVLRWAGVTDLDLAARIGADVAFCLVGGRARVRGVGEIVEPIDPVAEPITLITPPFHVSTPAVYRAWDELGGPSGSVNDLTEAALTVAPQLGEWRDGLADATGQEPVLAGSGGTWFVRGAYPGVEIDGVQAVVTMTVG